MARPERKTVDYFPHYISDGKKMFFIEHKYGNDGYATWFKILESLASTDNHYINFNDSTNIMFLSAKCKIDETRLFDILNDLARLGEINMQLWEQKVIYSDKFVESIQDAYSRRNNKCMTFDGLCEHLLSLCITLTPLKVKKSNKNTQSKVKEIKVNEIDFQDFGNDFEIHWQTWIGYKQNQFAFRYKETSSEQTAFNDLLKKSNNNKLQAIAIINNSIANGWKGLLPLRENYPGEFLNSQTIKTSEARPIGTTKSMFL